MPDKPGLSPAKTPLGPSGLSHSLPISDQISKPASRTGNRPHNRPHNQPPGRPPNRALDRHALIGLSGVLPNSSLGYFVQEIFLKLIQHPLLWVFLATGGVYWLLTKVTPRDLKTRLSIPIPAPDAKRW